MKTVVDTNTTLMQDATQVIYLKSNFYKKIYTVEGFTQCFTESLVFFKG